MVPAPMMRPRFRLSPVLALGAGLALAAALPPRPAGAVGVEVGPDETLEIAPLAGYCVLDEARPAEAQLIRTMRGAVGETMRVVLAFGDCNELVELRDGKRSLLDHFGQVLLLTENNAIQRVTDPRSAYLGAIAKPFPTATIEEVAANGEAQSKASKPADAPKPIFAVVARDELAVYIGTTSLQGRGEEKTMVAGLAGIGLIRQVPVNVNLFSAYDGSAETGKAVFEGLIGQMSAGIADLQFTNEDTAGPVALPVPNRSEWRAMGSTALVGAVAGGLIGGIGAIVVVLWRRRRRAAPHDDAGTAPTPTAPSAIEGEPATETTQGA